MKSTNLFIIILIVVILILGGVFAIKVLNTEKEELFEEGMEYAEEKSTETKQDLNAKGEKEKIQLAVSMALFGNGSVQGLTYNNLNELLKANLNINYTLNGPDSKGNFTVKIDNRTYNIDKNGTVNN